MEINRELKPGWLFFLPWSLNAVGGVNRVVTELCRVMRQQGEYVPYILISSWDDASPRIVEREYHTEIYLRIRKPTAENNTLKAIVSFLIYLPDSLLTLRNLYKKYNIKVVNPHYLITVAFQFYIYRKIMGQGTFLISSLHGADLSHGLAEATAGKANKIESYFFRRMLVTSDYIVACSTGLKEKVITHVPAVKAKTLSIPNGFSADVYTISNSNSELMLPQKKYILSVGTFEHKKGFDILLNAYARLCYSQMEFDLVLVGRSEPTLTALKKQIIDLNLTNRVHVYTDVRPDKMANFYKSASLFVLASRIEPFGIVLLEAAVNKVPVITTRTMGGSEIISDGIDGRLVNIDDADALAKAMSELLNQPKLMQKYADALFDKVTQKYTWEKACLSYSALARS